MHSQVIVCAIVLAVTYISSVIFKWTTSSLRSVPGPIWARVSRMWYFRQVSKGNFEHENIELHRRYGPIVRVAPDMYSIDLPDSVNQVYGISSKLPKSDWYEGWKHPSPDRWTMFPDQNIPRHAETRRRFQGLYSMSSLVSYEGYVNDCTDILQERLAGFAEADKAINMIHWFQCYAFDVIGEITYSKRFGFLDRGDDVSGLLKALDSAMVYSTLVGIYAFLHPYIFAVMSWLNVGGAAGRNYLMKFVEERIQDRKATRQDSEKPSQVDDNAPQDFLEKLLIQNDENPEKVTAYHVFMMGLSNIIAGADTTAISLSSILHNLILYPDVMKKLREEVDQNIESEAMEGEHFTFKQAREMPYLQAVIKEALRMHSATGLPLWRVVPPEGMQLGGKFFPGGTVIGLNTWCAHFNEDIFKDAGTFRPERWIEAEEKGGETLSRLNSYYMPFGLGSRTCIGKHISYLEMSKLIPLLVRNFDFEMAEDKPAWNTKNFWFVKPVNFWVKAKKRVF